MIFDAEIRFEDKVRDNIEKKMLAARDAVVTIIDMKKHLKEMLKQTLVSQIKYYYSKHKNKLYNAENKIYLNARNIKTKRSSKKLDYKYYDSYTIEHSMSKNAYKLILFSSMKNIHDVFHVFLLKSYRDDHENEKSSLIELNEKEQWEIEKILNSKVRYEKLNYLIKWLEYSDTDNQWLLVSELKNVKELIQNFHRKYSTKSNKDDRAFKRRRV